MARRSAMSMEFSLPGPSDASCLQEFGDTNDQYTKRNVLLRCPDRFAHHDEINRRVLLLRWVLLRCCKRRSLVQNSRRLMGRDYSRNTKFSP